MLKPEDINWDRAPEGAQAAILSEEGPGLWTFGRWRKFEGDAVFYFKNGQWVRNTTATVDGWKRANAHVLKPEAKEAPLPNGLKWPDGYDYFNPDCGGFFFNLTHYFCNGIKNKWPDDMVNFWLRHKETIKRNGGVDKEQVVKDQPKPKVGWWN